MPEQASYQALQQQLSQLGTAPLPGSGASGAGMNGIFESLIEAAPMMFAAGADARYDTNLTGMVNNIATRRMQQQQLARENELDLRKFQLTVGLKGFEAELAKIESERQGRIADANIAQSQAATRASDASVRRSDQEIKQSGERFPVELEGLRANIAQSQAATQASGASVRATNQSIEQARERFPVELEDLKARLAESAELRPLKRRKAEQEIAAGNMEIEGLRANLVGQEELRPLKKRKAEQEIAAGDMELEDNKALRPLQRRRLEAETSAAENQNKNILAQIEQRDARQKEITRLMDSTDPALQKQGRYALLFEQPPPKEDGVDGTEAFMTKLFPASSVYFKHPTDKGNAILSAQIELVEQVGPVAPAAYTVLNEIADLSIQEKVSSEDKARLLEYALDELSPSIGLLKGDAEYQRNLNREVIMPLAKITGKKVEQIWDTLLKGYDRKTAVSDSVKDLGKPAPKKETPAAKKKEITKENIPDSPLRKFKSVVDPKQDPKQLADYTAAYNKKKTAVESERKKKKDAEDEKERKRLADYTAEYNRKRKALGLPTR